MADYCGWKTPAGLPFCWPITSYLAMFTTRGTAALLTAILLVLVSMDTGVVGGRGDGSKCSFNGTYLSSLGSLDLVCGCPPGDAFELNIWAIDLTAKHSPRVAEKLFDKGREAATKPDIEVIAKENLQPHEKQAEKRIRLHLRRANYIVTKEDINYTCIVNSKPLGHSSVQTDLKLQWVKELPVPKTMSKRPTTTSPPSSPSTTTTTTTHSVSPTDPTRVAATADTEEGPLSKVGLYTVVALSCILVIIIVLAIICFVRVRARRRREKLDRQESLDLNYPLQPTANQNLILKLAEEARATANNFEDQTCRHGGCTCNTIPSPPGKMIGQNGLCPSHGACASRGQPLQLAHGTSVLKEKKRAGTEERAGGPPEGVPLLASQGNLSMGKRIRSVSSEDEDDLHRRRERLLKDAPRRRYPREHIPALDHSWSANKLDLAQPSHGNLSRSHRYSFPRNRYDDTSDEDFAGLVHHHAAFVHPPRSLSQQSLRRQPRHHRQASPGRCQTPRAFHASDLEDDGAFQTTPLTLPNGQRYLLIASPTHRPPVGFGPGRQGAEATPLTVRVREDNNVVYENHYPHSGMEESGSRDGDSGMYQEYEAGDPFEASRLTETSRRYLAGDHPGQFGPTVEGMAVPHLADDPVSRQDQQSRHLQDAQYPAPNVPSKRHRQYSSPSRTRYYSSTSAPRHYNTTSMPRHRSAKRAAHSQRPLRYNRSQPQLFYVSEGEAGWHLATDSDNDPMQQWTHQAPSRRQRRGRSMSHSAGDMLNDVLDADPRLCYDGRDHRRPPPHMAAPQPNQGLRQLLSPRDNESQRQMNLLSRESVTPSRGRTTALNVPVGNQSSVSNGSATGRQTDNTQRKRPTAEPAHASRARGQRDEDPRPGGSRSRSRAKASDSSPNTTPPRDRRSSLSSSDNDNVPPRSRRPCHQEDTTEINIRDIKNDNETRRKRPISFKAGNSAHPPVVCAADMAESQSGATHVPRGLQKKESTRSSQSRGDYHQERREGQRPASERWPEQLGIEILPSTESGSNGHFSQYTEHNHSTSVKTPHP